MDAPLPEPPAPQPESPAPQPESPVQQASAPEADMLDAAAPDAGPGLSPLVDSRQSSQAPAEPPQPQPRLPEGSLGGANGAQSPISVPSGSSSSHSTPGPQLQPLPLPLPPPSSTPVPVVASAPPPQPGPPAVPHSQTSSPRPTPVAGPVPTGNSSPVAGPHQGHDQQQPPPPQQPPLPATHYQQLLPPAHHAPPQPLPVNQGYPVQPSPLQQGKVAIVEPPRPAHRAGGPNTNAMLSPGRDHVRANPKFNEDTSRLTHAIQQSLPEAVRHVTREHWEKTLLGSDYHHNFVMSAGFLHSNAIALQRAVGDNGRKMVFHAKRELIHHFEAADLDAVADDILAKASDKFLDKALEIRLATIDARSLINALARNGRLGYESNEGDGNTAPAPAHAPAPAPPGPHTQPAYPHPPAHATHTPAHVQPNTMPNPPQSTGPPLRRLQPQLGSPGSGNQQPMQCGLCWRHFQAASAFEFHTKKAVCTKKPPDANGFPFNCPFCGTGFITATGKNYHHMNKVCGDHGMIPATLKTPKARASPITLSSGTSSPVRHIPPSATPNTAPRASQAVPAASMPQAAYRNSPYRSSPGQASTPVSSQKFSSDDPYSHLKPTTRQKLEEELYQAELSYRPRFQELATIADANERLKRQEGLQNSFSTKQSIIRKKYGVRLRQRRTKAEIDAERERVTGTSTAFPRKRQRTDSDTPSSPLPKTHVTPTPHLSVMDMNSAGLVGTGATAAMADPTVDQTHHAVPRHSLASYQRSGYRVSTHVPVGSRPSSSHHQDVPMADASTEGESRTQSPDPKIGSTTDPIVLDASSSGSESDEDIPATLPPAKAPSASSTGGLAG